MSKAGVVYWITGLSGSGKTVVGRALVKKLKRQGLNVVFLDGDELRAVLGGKAGYSKKERFQLAMQYARLCRMLSEQGLHVVCSTISMFHNVRNWNREHIRHYKEIYLKNSLKFLSAHDRKGIYKRKGFRKPSCVVGLDLDFEEPENPDLLIRNDRCESAYKIAEQVIQGFSVRGDQKWATKKKR